MEYYINLNSVYRVDPSNNLVEEYKDGGWQGLLHMKVKDVRHQDGFLWVSKNKAMEEIDRRDKKLQEDLEALRNTERIDSGIY